MDCPGVSVRGPEDKPKEQAISEGWAVAVSFTSGTLRILKIIQI